MEQLNRIQLRGIVGSIRVSDISGKRVARITLATNHAYRSQDGCAVIETTWHNVVAWEGQNITCLDSLKKGDAVDVIGRLKNQRYTGTDGIEHYITEITAQTVTPITEQLKMEG